ncbi:hypothetical protein [Thalassotalea eurytherma]|uniref:Uncharacterized protein n=1 Tax=Thalassotalea eurytherma TaxID=1144278 RepID=A0ABQ6H2S0_9GAMM|nr:hypothetical protein [Thalassotalea eurytherma]GLX82483.1 hypothetical protein theurythT_19350 [Thalassotalea eurytherma]
MPNKSLINRLAGLEQKTAKPSPIHIILKSSAGETDEQAFNNYRVKRMSEGYEPECGWQALKDKFLSGSIVQDAGVEFITFDVIDSVAPYPPKITKGKS